MDCFPSPPRSPYLEVERIRFEEPYEQDVICGDCNKLLGSDWFCSDCHKKCYICNRFLSQDEYCSRCWSFDQVEQKFKRKVHSSFMNALPSQQDKPIYHQPSFLLPTPSNSTGSESKN